MFEFAIASLVLIAIPGPDQALIIRNALVRGRAAGVQTMLGGATGLLLHATAAALGISALLAASATAYTTLKLAGVAYLLYLGVRMLRSASKAGSDGAESEAVPGRRSFSQGLLSNAMNPKVALFFLTFLPQFLPDDGPQLPAALALAAIFEVLYLAWFLATIAIVDVVGDWLRRPRARAWMERVSGSTLIGFGARLAASSRP
jgi:RhtB (resistance to homoserine/threonine) family protein